MPRATKPRPPDDLANTAWRFKMTGGVQTYVFHFQPRGVMWSRGPKQQWDTQPDQWELRDGALSIRMSGGYALYEGRLEGGKLRGTARNVKNGHAWEFVGSYVGEAEAPRRRKKPARAKVAPVKRAAAKARPSAPSPRGRRPARRR